MNKIKLYTLLLICFIVSLLGHKTLGQDKVVITCPKGDRYVCYEISAPNQKTVTAKKGEGDATVEIYF